MLQPTGMRGILRPMPVDNLDDKPLDSSTSDPSTGTTEAPAAPETDSSTPQPQLSSQGDEQVTPVAPPKAVDVKTAIDFLTGKPDAPKTTEPVTPTGDEPPTKDAGKVDPAKAEKPKLDKPAEPPVDEDEALSPDEKARLGQHAQKRIKELHRKAKDAETRLRELDPVVQRGKAFDSVIQTYKLDQDLADLHPEQGDADVAGAIRFNAALNRLAAGRGSQSDQSFVKSAFDYFGSAAQKLGIEVGARQEFDVAALEAAVEKADKEFDLTDLRAIVQKAKARTAPSAAAAPASIPTQHPVQPSSEQTRQPEPPAPNLDLMMYSSRLEETIKSSNVGDVRTYFNDKVLPAVYADLKQKYPSADPVKLYQSASPQARYEASIQAHQTVQKQMQALKPRPAPVAASTPRPVAGTGTTAHRSAPAASGIAAAINFLSQGE